MNKILNWFNDITGITALKAEIKSLIVEVSSQTDFIERKLREINDLTRMDADIGVRGKCTIILTGVYRNTGYVKFYDVDYQEFQWHVDQFKKMRKHSLVRNIDSPIQFRGAFKL